MKHKQISYLDLNAIPKRPHQVYVNLSLKVGGKKAKQNFSSQAFQIISNTGYSACTLEGVFVIVACVMNKKTFSLSSRRLYCSFSSPWPLYIHKLSRQVSRGKDLRNRAGSVAQW